MKFYIADAFTDNLFGGNPAGVVIVENDFPDDELCVRTAAELRYSETAFVKRTGEKEFTTRYFTPASEVDLCGHATIATFHVLYSSGIIGNGKYINRTLAGDLEIEVSDGYIMMEMGSPVKISDIAEDESLRELYSIMGIEYEHVTYKGKTLLPSLISTGLPDIIMPVSSLQILDSITPDFPALSSLSERYGVVGVHAFTCDMKDSETCHTRNFAPLYDIDEEAATGTSSGALTYYLYDRGIIEPGYESFFIQGEAMKRPSGIITRLVSPSEILVGGNAHILVSGEIYI